MPVATIIDNIEDGMQPEEVASEWELPLEAVLAIYHYALNHDACPVR